jgi:hypothetical protein
MSVPTTKAREAYRLSNDLMTDLVSGAHAYSLLLKRFEGLSGQVPDQARIALTRLCLFHAIITLAKWSELYDRYKGVIPADIRDAAKDLRSRINDRGIVDFRNKVAGHVWDKDQRRPLTNAEVQHRLDAVTGSDVPTFLRWITDTESPENPFPAVRIIESVRDRLAAANGFTDADLQP